MHGPPRSCVWHGSFEVGALNNSSCFDARLRRVPLQISYSEEPFQLSRWDLCDEGRAGRNAEVSKAIAKLKFLLRNQTLSNFRGLFIWWATLIDCLILYPKFWIPFSRYFERQSSHCVSSKSFIEQWIKHVFSSLMLLLYAPLRYPVNYLHYKVGNGVDKNSRETSRSPRVAANESRDPEGERESQRPSSPLLSFGLTTAIRISTLLFSSE